MINTPDSHDDQVAAAQPVPSSESAPVPPPGGDRLAHIELGAGDHDRIRALSPNAMVHLIRLAFMFGTKVPAGSRWNKHKVAYLREAVLGRFLLHIASDPADFEAAAAECDWTVQ